jgi:hypothetical protein
MSVFLSKIGDTFTTRKSHVTGTIKEIIKRPDGHTVVLLDVNGEDRYTTI